MPVTRKTSIWTSPIFPGLGKSRLVGFLVGFLLGPFGVGLFLRSIVDFVLSFIMCSVLLGVFEMKGAPICWVACGLWVVVRSRWDTNRLVKSRNAEEADETPDQASLSQVKREAPHPMGVLNEARG